MQTQVLLGRHYPTVDRNEEKPSSNGPLINCMDFFLQCLISEFGQYFDCNFRKSLFLHLAHAPEKAGAQRWLAVIAKQVQSPGPCQAEMCKRYWNPCSEQPKTRSKPTTMLLQCWFLVKVQWEMALLWLSHCRAPFPESYWFCIKTCKITHVD